MGKIEDRRDQGVHRVEIADGNGGKTTAYHVNVERVRAWAAVASIALGMLVTIGGGVFAAVKLGIASEVHGQMKIEMEPGGMLRRDLEDVSQEKAQEAIEEVQGVIQDDLDSFEDELDDVDKLGRDLQRGQTQLQEQVQAIQSQVTSNHEEIMRLLRGGDTS